LPTAFEPFHVSPVAGHGKMSGQVGLLDRQSLPDGRLYLPASHVLVASPNDAERLVHLAPVESAIMFNERILERREIGSQVSKLTAKGSEVKMLPEQESGMDSVKGGWPSSAGRAEIARYT